MCKNFLTDFKNFISRGNVIDMAIGIIIGAAFGKIVDSLVKDIIMPPIGFLMGKVDFSNLYFQIYPLDEKFDSLSAAQSAGAVTINYGQFLNTIISFIIVAIAAFVLIKVITKLQQTIKTAEDAAEDAATKTCPYCCSTIDINAKKCPHCTSDL